MKVTIRNASPDQAAILSAIALQAKGYWGYTGAQLEEWRLQFLTISPEDICENQVWVAVVDEQIVGFAAVKERAGAMLLDDLWVLPAFIGCGIGKQLFRHVAERVPDFRFTADPHADGFYYKMGAKKIGEQQSTIQGRMLTLFRYQSAAT